MENSPERPDVFKLERMVSLKQSILVIEDNADLLYLYEFILEQGGFDVFTAQSGSEAIATLSQIDQPDLILLDMQLGDMLGTELLTLLEEKRPEIIEKVPVVFLTGSDMIPISKAVGIIRKPVDSDKLLEITHRFIKIGTGSSSRNKY